MADESIIILVEKYFLLIYTKIKIMQNEKEIEIGSAEDPDNPAKALSKLRNINAPSNVRGKIIYIPWERTKILCPYHRIRTLINMADSAQRDKNNKMIEYECDCGVIYIRTKDINKVDPEWRHV